MSDTQSLTLPKATSRGRRRVRRPRKPDPFWLIYVLWCAAFALIDWLTGQWLFAVGQGIYLAGAWPVLLGRRRAMAWPVLWAGVAVFLLAVILDLAGIA